ncbi:MAG: ATP-binding cassette domain-containing protein, partial [Pseudomonadales bacterium]|nr:ATP-binding cassette domain-containing protein [Pseudomonadales bacterium]
IQLLRGGKPLLERANLLVHSGQRVGVIGANGCGKSSLFLMLLGKLPPDARELYIPKDRRIAHMAQEVGHSTKTALDHVLDGDTDLRETEQEIKLAEEAADNNALAHAYAKLESLDGYSAPSRAQQLLHGLGFGVADYQRPVKDFSGGWRIRLNLAQALMCPSDILLLDEPTNHLDLDATLWLEQWLLRYQGTLLLISHDRDFLDTVTTHIAHLERHAIHCYTGNYSNYERQRAERLALQQAQYQKQQARVEEIQRFVNRFRAKATKAKQAQSRLKSLARMELIEAAHVDSPFHFSFFEPSKKSNPLISLKKADLGYGEQAILKQVSLIIMEGSRIGLLGPNGAGKSTLLKTLVDELPMLTGEKVLGENLKIGYFAQHQLEALDINASPLLHIQRLSPKSSEQSIRDFLGGFDFRGDMATGSIEHFSGGEKARLALALVVWQKPNLLIMDEPTNHLDLEMRQALTAALQSFSGAMILVSHDRHLLRSSADEFLLVAQGKVREFEGDLEDYQNWLVRVQRDEAAPRQTAEESLTPPAEKKLDKSQLRRAAAAQREQLKPLTQVIKKLEQQIADNEKELAAIETRLHDTNLYQDSGKDELRTLLQHQGKLREQTEQLEDEWLQQSEALEAIKSGTD